METTPNARQRNTQLIWIGILQFFLIAILGILCLPLIYVLVTGQRETTMTSLVSAVIAMLAFAPLYFKHGVSQRKQFIANGGDPTGMNLWMFGAMGGEEWKNR